MNIQYQIRSQEKFPRGRFRVHYFGGADLKNCLEGDLVFILVVVPISGKIPRGRFRVHSRGGGSIAPVRRGKKAVACGTAWHAAAACERSCRFQVPAN
jgi:hypothetical protein